MKFEQLTAVKPTDLDGQSLHRHTIIEAIYAPRDWDSVVPCWAARFLGRRHRWVTSFVFDSGPHAGQWALLPCAPRSLDACETDGRGVAIEDLSDRLVLGTWNPS